MQVKPEIFKAYDIRGLCPEEITPAFAYVLGRAFMAVFLGDENAKNRKMIVGQDARPTSPELAKELIRGLRDGGADVTAMGRTTTPLFYFAVNASKAAGGIMVTASHNPAKYNGFKIVKAGSVAIGIDSGLAQLRDAVIEEKFPEAAPESSLRDEDFREAYLASLTNGVHVNKFKIAVDAGNGMIGILLPQFLGRLGIDARSLYMEPDGTFPNHEANPLKEETMDDLKKLMKAHPVDFGVAFDGDADRIRFLLPDGTPVPGDIMLAFLAKLYLTAHPGSTIVYAVNCSRMVAETVERYGGVAVPWKIGHTLIKEKMRQTGAILGGEISTHYFFRELGTVESTMLTLIRVCQELTRTGKTLAEELAQFTKYAKTPETNFEVADKEGAMKRLADLFADAKVNWLDGLTVEYPDWWFNVRPSNTEPLLRLNLEAKDRMMMDEKLEEVGRVIQE